MGIIESETERKLTIRTASHGEGVVNVTSYLMQPSNSGSVQETSQTPKKTWKEDSQVKERSIEDNQGKTCMVRNLMPNDQSAEKSLELLYELSKLVSRSTDLSQVLNEALKLLATTLHMMRGAITLISPENGAIRIYASYGLKPEEQERGRYVRGEGITGQVIASGEPMYVSNVSREPRFLNKTQARDLKKESISFLCVPIKLDNAVAGALSVDQLLSAAPSLAAEIRLLEIIAAILAHAALESQLIMDRKTGLFRPEGLIGTSSEMENVFQLINQVADSSACVLLLGESGTGKELCARAIHNRSPRRKKPFISLNCAALPENLIESELFGHEMGAFTGAHRLRKGRFELAHEGTLFLDEIGELPLPTQAKLLRVLQTLTFERVGGMCTQQVDVRFICATNRDLSAMVEQGSFRQDLFYRIDVFPIELPPLRARRCDILSIAAALLEKHNRDRKRCIRLSTQAQDLLENHPWPGNVRELENVMERACLLLGNETLILPKHLPGLIHEHSQHPTDPLPLRLEKMESTAIKEALCETCGNMRKAAATLGVTERVLSLRMQKYGLNFRDFRNQA